MALYANENLTLLKKMHSSECQVTGIQKQKPQPCHRGNCSLAEGNHPGAIDADVATDVDDDDAVDAVDDTEADNVRGGAANHDAGTL